MNEIVMNKASPVRKTNPAHLRPDAFSFDPRNFGEDIALDDHRIAFVLPTVRGKEVLDIGCVEHDPRNYRSRYWVHKAIKAHAASVLGLDLYAEGVRELRGFGFDVVVGDAQTFDLGRTFDVVVAGDVVMNLEDLHGFFSASHRHLRPHGRLLITVPNPWFWRNMARFTANGASCGNPEQMCWLCPTTATQIAARHGFSRRSASLGSRSKWARWTPLPAIVKHTTFHLDFERR